MNECPDNDQGVPMTSDGRCEKCGKPLWTYPQQGLAQHETRKGETNDGEDPLSHRSEMEIRRS